jgi:hypothetical protein
MKIFCSHSWKRDFVPLFISTFFGGRSVSSYPITCYIKLFFFNEGIKSGLLGQIL